MYPHDRWFFPPHGFQSCEFASFVNTIQLLFSIAHTPTLILTTRPRSYRDRSPDCCTILVTPRLHPRVNACYSTLNSSCRNLTHHLSLSLSFSISLSSPLHRRLSQGALRLMPTKKLSTKTKSKRSCVIHSYELLSARRPLSIAKHALPELRHPNIFDRCVCHSRP